MTRTQIPYELARRERQIMDIVFRLGKVSVADVLKELPVPPTYSAVRATMRLLEGKGLITHERQGLRYVYKPTLTLGRARISVLRHLLKNFFGGSTAEAVAALLELPDSTLTPQDVKRLKKLVQAAKEEGR